MARILGRPSSDGSYWTINLNSTNLCSYPPGSGLIKMDLHLKHTMLVESGQDEHGNPRQSEEELYQVNFPTVVLFRTYNRTLYSYVLRWWLQLNLQGDVVDDVADQVIEHVFENTNVTSAIHVQIDLNRVSTEHVLLVESDLDWLDEIEEEEDEDMAGSGLDESLIELLMKVNVFPPPAKEELECLGLRDCSICLDDLVIGGGDDKTNYLFKSRPCGHIFHGECMNKWLRNSDSCPLCRIVVSSEIMKE